MWMSGVGTISEKCVGTVTAWAVSVHSQHIPPYIIHTHAYTQAMAGALLASGFFRTAASMQQYQQCLTAQQAAVFVYKLHLLGAENAGWFSKWLVTQPFIIITIAFTAAAAAAAAAAATNTTTTTTTNTTTNTTNTTNTNIITTTTTTATPITPTTPMTPTTLHHTNHTHHTTPHHCTTTLPPHRNYTTPLHNHGTMLQMSGT